MPMSERLLTPMTHGPAQAYLNENEKKERTFITLKKR
jgi:hypothetical protein